MLTRESSWRSLGVVVVILSIYMWSVSAGCDYDLVLCQKDRDELTLSCSGRNVLHLVTVPASKNPQNSFTCSNNEPTILQACYNNSSALSHRTSCQGRRSCRVTMADIVPSNPADCPLHHGSPFVFIQYRCEPPTLPSGRAWTKAICQGQRDPLPWVYIHSKRSDRPNPFIASTFCFCTLRVDANVEVQVRPVTFTTQPPSTVSCRQRLVLVDGQTPHIICSTAMFPFILNCSSQTRHLTLSYINDDPVNSTASFNVSISSTGHESMRIWCGQSSTTPKIPATRAASVPPPESVTRSSTSTTTSTISPTSTPVSSTQSTPPASRKPTEPSIVPPSNPAVAKSDNSTTPVAPTQRPRTPSSRAPTRSYVPTSRAPSQAPPGNPSTPSLPPSPTTRASSTSPSTVSHPSTAEPPTTVPSSTPATSEASSRASPSTPSSSSSPVSATTAANTTADAAAKSTSKTTPSQPGQNLRPNRGKKQPKNTRIMEDIPVETPDTVETDDSNISTGITVGVVAGCLVIFAILFVAISITCIRVQKKKQQSHYVEATDASDHVYAEPVYYTVPYETPPYDQDPSDATIDRNRGTITVGNRHQPRQGVVGGADQVAYNPLFGADQQSGMLFAY